jgi:hypothetical protein
VSHELDDDALDAALGQLGLPQEAAPVASAAEILARVPVVSAVTQVSGVAPVVGAARLAAIVALSVGIGFGGGLVAAGIAGERLGVWRDGGASAVAASAPAASLEVPAPSERASAPDTVAAAGNDVVPAQGRVAPGGASPRAAVPEGGSASPRRPAARGVRPRRPVPGADGRASSGGGASAGRADAPTASPTDGAAQAPTDGTAEVLNDAPIDRLADVVHDGAADVPNDELVADLGELLKVPVERPAAPATTRVAVTAAAIAAFPPANTELPPNGIALSAGLNRRFGVDRRAWFAGGVADVGLLAGRDGRAFAGAVTGVGGLSWAWPAARVDVGWSASVRAMTDVHGRAPEDRPPTEGRGGPPAPVLVGTGPRAAVSIGETDGMRLHLDVSTQLVGGQRTPRPLPWLEIGLGFDFGVKNPS